jgi:two-component system chemotaxis sensor kinase CheA
MSDNHELNVDEGLLIGFLDESMDLLGEVDSLFVQLESNPGDLEIVNAIFRPVHSIKGNAPFFGYTKLRTLAHEMETVLALVRDRTLVVTQEMIGTLLRGTDVIKAILTRVRGGDPEILDEEAFQSLVQETTALAESQELTSEQMWQGIFTGLEKLNGGVPNELQGTLQELEENLNRVCPHAPEELRERIIERGPRNH